MSGKETIFSRKQTAGQRGKQALGRFIWAAQLKFDFDADGLLKTVRNLFISVQSFWNPCANLFVKIDTQIKICLPYKSPQNEFAVEVNTKPISYTSVKITSLPYKCTLRLDSDRHFNINNARSTWTDHYKGMCMNGTLLK